MIRNLHINWVWCGTTTIEVDIPDGATPDEIDDILLSAAEKADPPDCVPDAELDDYELEDV